MEQATAKQTKRVALGVLLASVVMILVFYCAGRLTMPVIWGALLGAAVAIGDFILLGLALQKAVKDEANAKLIVKASYNVRVLITVAAVVVGFYAPVFHIVAVAVPLLAARITIYILRYLESKQTVETDHE